MPNFLIGAIATDNKGEEYPALRGGWRVITDTQFYYKVLGDYPIGAADQLIWDNWIDDAVTRWETMRSMNGGTPKPPMGIRPTMGFDVADLGPDKHSLGFRYGGWWDVPETWQDTDPDMAAERAAHRYKEKNAKIAQYPTQR